jgi:hypothetical protein
MPVIFNVGELTVTLNSVPWFILQYVGIFLTAHADHRDGSLNVDGKLPFRRLENPILHLFESRRGGTTNRSTTKPHTWKYRSTQINGRRNRHDYSSRGVVDPRTAMMLGLGPGVCGTAGPVKGVLSLHDVADP